MPVRFGASAELDSWFDGDAGAIHRICILAASSRVDGYWVLQLLVIALQVCGSQRSG